MTDKNREITELVLPQGSVVEFDASPYPCLRTLNCVSRGCELLDVSANELLEELDCNMNMLATLDVSACENLQNLDCSFNVLEELFLPSVSDLRVLDCSHNNLTTLDLSGAADLDELYCDANEQLENIDFPSWEGEEISLCFLDISYTALNGEWLKKVKFFPSPKEGFEDQLFVFGSPLAEDADALSFLKQKGWEPVTEEE